ncbi:contact-dependent growth inhibition system immunity protein [Pseudomonas lini]
MSARFPALFQFLAGYFHEDWSCDHESEDDVVRSFVAESSPERISQVKDELQVVFTFYPK